MLNETSELLKPLLTQIILTIAVWIYMYITRVNSMMRNRVKVQDLATDEGFLKIKDAENPSDNFENLFELPVLFYVLILVLAYLGRADFIFLFGAWFFVITRICHSIVHCTFNHVMTRFVLYFSGAIVLFGMWIRLCYSIVIG